jgi:hypothetical protein
LCRSRIPATCSNKIDQLIESLARSHASNPKLVELLGLLAVRNGGQLPAVESWIEKLIDTLSSKAGTAKHREVVKVLLKQKNGTLLKVLPPNFDYFVLMSES